jgi:hypothetical protein
VQLQANAVGMQGAQPYLVAPNPEPFDWTAPDATEAQQYMLDGTRIVSIRCLPKGDSGAGTAEVAIDYAEVRVHYSGQ